MLLFFCVGVPERSHSVLLQYSVNGGISWLLLDEFYFPASTDTLFLHLPLPASAQTNATRFRLWQPYNSGEETRWESQIPWMIVKPLNSNQFHPPGIRMWHRFKFHVEIHLIFSNIIDIYVQDAWERPEGSFVSSLIIMSFLLHQVRRRRCGW